MRTLHAELGADFAECDRELGLVEVEDREALSEPFATVTSLRFVLAWYTKGASI